MPMFFSAAVLLAALYVLLKVQTRKPIPAYAAFKFAEEDDSDIKIAVEGKTPRSSVGDDTQPEAAELEEQRKKGNITKARGLGAMLCEKIISEDGESAFGQDESESSRTRMQRRLLLAFALTSAVESEIASKVLRGVVLNTFYDELRSTLPEFYNDIGETGAFSFYTLCARRGGSVERCIGRTFAMLAGRDGDPVMEELGEALYFHFIDTAKKAIKTIDFK